MAKTMRVPLKDHIEKYKVFVVLNNKVEFLQIGKVAGTRYQLPHKQLASLQLGDIWWPRHDHKTPPNARHGYERIV